MGKKFERCIRKVRSRIRTGKIPKTFVDPMGKRKESNPFAICRGVMK